jgi:hypothetical protein
VPVTGYAISDLIAEATLVPAPALTLRRNLATRIRFVYALHLCGPTAVPATLISLSLSGACMDGLHDLRVMLC